MNHKRLQIKHPTSVEGGWMEEEAGGGKKKRTKPSCVRIVNIINA